MIFANYSRKSVFKDNSDSIKNQSRMSQEYAEAHFPGQVEKFLSYSDEDYSGANADRPDLKRLLSDIRLGRINALIVYQLDRLSRNIKDFAEIYSVLEEHDVQFVSVKENIDTTTPIGKAMMYIIVVFAQMECETICPQNKKTTYLLFASFFYSFSIVSVFLSNIPYVLSCFRQVRKNKVSRYLEGLH